MENLNSFREALVEFGKEHRWDQSTNNKFHLYLLASISDCIILILYQPLAALDRIVRMACRLAIGQLLLELQPFLQGLLSRS
ncbi:exocyst complex component 3-like protein [Salvelinus alpinus]